MTEWYNGGGLWLDLIETDVGVTVLPIPSDINLYFDTLNTIR